VPSFFPFLPFLCVATFVIAGLSVAYSFCLDFCFFFLFSAFLEQLLSDFVYGSTSPSFPPHSFLCCSLTLTAGPLSPPCCLLLYILRRSLRHPVFDFTGPVTLILSYLCSPFIFQCPPTWSPLCSALPPLRIWSPARVPLLCWWAYGIHLLYSRALRVAWSGHIVSLLSTRI